METPLIKKNCAVTFAMLVSCFALWGLLNNMTDNLVPAFQRIFAMSQRGAGMVTVAFYGAYAVLAVFASILVEEFSYRVGVLIGLGIYIAGATMFVPACALQSFDVYFVAIFTIAAGCSLLETTCNPYILSLGDEATAVRRLNLAQAFNPVGSLVGIFLARNLVLARLNPATAAERLQMPADQLRAIVHTELFRICVPYIGLCVLAVFLWMFFLSNKDKDSQTKPGALRRVLIVGFCSLAPMILLGVCFPQMDKVQWVLWSLLGPLGYVAVSRATRPVLLHLLSSPRYLCGVVAQFFYVGVQIAAWTWMNVYCQKELGVPPQTGALYFIAATVLFVVGRWVATAAMRFVSAGMLLSIFSVGAIACALGVVYLPSTALFNFCTLTWTPNALCLVGMSGFMSLMFPTIYGIALEGIKPFAFKLGAAFLIMAILGGAIVTPWMASIIGAETSPLFVLISGFSNTMDASLHASSVSLRAAYFVPVLCFGVILLYSLIFSRKKAN